MRYHMPYLLHHPQIPLLRIGIKPNPQERDFGMMEQVWHVIPHFKALKKFLWWKWPSFSCAQLRSIDLSSKSGDYALGAAQLTVSLFLVSLWFWRQCTKRGRGPMKGSVSIPKKPFRGLRPRQGSCWKELKRAISSPMSGPHFKANTNSETVTAFSKV